MSPQLLAGFGATLDAAGLSVILIGEGLRFPQDFPDGHETFLVVEAGKPVPWTKPEDLVYDPSGPLPDLRGLFHDGFRAHLVDGSGRWVSRETSEAALRAAITRNGGEKVRPDW